MENTHEKGIHEKINISSKSQKLNNSNKSSLSRSSSNSDSDNTSSKEENRRSNKHKIERSRRRSSSRSRSDSRKKRHSHRRSEKDRRDDGNRKFRRHLSSDRDSDVNSNGEKKRKNQKIEKIYEKDRNKYYEREKNKERPMKEYKSDFEGKSKRGMDDEGEKKNKENKPPIVKEKPNFNATGILARETNTVNGVVLKFTEPVDSSEPNEEWRLYCFKESETQDVIPIDHQSYYLIGKDDRICNILLLHPSCSRQHAVIQYRKIDGIVRPYLMDLESANGTFIDKERLEPARYYELKNNDLINFGMSTRDYVLLKGGSV